MYLKATKDVSLHWARIAELYGRMSCEDYIQFAIDMELRGTS